MDDYSQITRREAAKRLLMAAGAAAVAGCNRTEPIDPTKPLTLEDRRLSMGTVIRHKDKAYEEVRRSMVWNGVKPNRKPDVIVQATDVDEVRSAVIVAAAEKRKIAVRGGGHSWIGAPLREGGMLLDVSGLSQLDVDPVSRLITAGPGVKNQEMAKVLTLHNLAFPVGHCPGVRLSGYLLGGGFGWNSGTWGPACLSVRAVQVVTADGSVVNASEKENPDLLWAARGAGAGFFGVVTQYTLAAYPLPKAIRQTTLFFPASDAAALGRWLAEISPKLPPQVELTTLVTTAGGNLPPGAPAAGQPMIMVWGVAFGDTDEQSKQMLQPLQSPPTKGAVVPPSPTTIEQLLDQMGQAYVPGLRYGVDMSWLTAGPADLLPRVTKAMSTVPSPRTTAMMVFLPPPPKDAPPMPDVALSMFGPSLVGLYGIWEKPEDDAANQKWVADTAAGLKDATIGHYVGEADLLTDKNRPSRCFSDAAWKKLRELKARYDPENIFHDFPGLG